MTNMYNVNVYTTGSEKTSTGRAGWRKACRPPACRRPPPGARARTPSGLTAPARTASSAAARSPENVVAYKCKDVAHTVQLSSVTSCCWPVGLRRIGAQTHKYSSSQYLQIVH